MGLYDRIRDTLGNGDDGDRGTDEDAEGGADSNADSVGDRSEETVRTEEAADSTTVAPTGADHGMSPTDASDSMDGVCSPSDAEDDRLGADDDRSGVDRRRSGAPTDRPRRHGTTVLADGDGERDDDPAFEDLAAATEELATAAAELDEMNRSLRTAAEEMPELAADRLEADEDGDDFPADTEPSATDRGADDDRAPPMADLRPTVESAGAVRDLAAAFVANHVDPGQGSPDGSVPEYQFDYSPASLADVDRMLATELPQFSPAADRSAGSTTEGGDDALARTVTGVGSYLGEVFVRTYDGMWTFEDGIPEVRLEDSGGAATSIDVFRLVAESVRRGLPIGAVHDALAARTDAVSRRVYDGDGPATGVTSATARTGPEPTDVELADPAAGAAPDAEPDESGDRPRQLIQQAEAFAASAETAALTFEPSSLRQLDALAATARGNELADLDPETDSRRLLAHALPYGAYFGEVIRRSHPGRAAWLDDDGYTIGLVAEEAAGQETAVTVDAVQAAATCLIGNDTFRDVYERLLDARSPDHD
jgi:hypothetical protein